MITNKYILHCRSVHSTVPGKNAWFVDDNDIGWSKFTVVVGSHHLILLK